MLVLLQLPKQPWLQAEAWTTPDSWWCAVESGTNMSDPSSPVSCELGTPLDDFFFLHVSQMLDWTEILGFGGQVSASKSLLWTINHFWTFLLRGSMHYLGHQRIPTKIHVFPAELYPKHHIAVTLGDALTPSSSHPTLALIKQSNPHASPFLPASNTWSLGRKCPLTPKYIPNQVSKSKFYFTCQWS